MPYVTPPDFTAFTTLPADSLDILGNDIEELHNGTGFAAGALKPTSTNNPYKFSVYRNSAVTLPAGTSKIAWDAEEYDTGSNFDSTTNRRFVAPVSGFYRFNAAVSVLTAGDWVFNIMIYKNGAVYKTIGQTKTNGSNTSLCGFLTGMQLSATDYVELYAFSADSGSNNLNVGAANTWFMGAMESAT